MPSPLIDYNRACANDSDPQVAVANHPVEPGTGNQAPLSLQYGTQRVLPSSVGFTLPLVSSDPTADFTQPVPVDAEGTRHPKPSTTVTSIGRRFAAPANDDGYPEGIEVEPPSARLPDVDHANVLSAPKDEAPPTALLLVSAARTSAPVVEEAFLEQQGHTTSPSLDAAELVREPVNSPIAAQAVAPWWQDPQKRLRTLYLALIPAVILVNVGYEGIRDKIREIGRAIDGVTSLQRQVAELKKPVVQSVPATQALIGPGNPITQPIPPGVMQSSPANASQISMPSPMGNPGADPEGKPARSEKGVPRQSAARDRGVDPDDGIPEEGEFVLATETKKAPARQPEAKVPPANEFKLIGDK